MTTISLLTNDQALSVVLKPLVSSGDYNLVKVQVEFDSAWERYPVRSAVFRTLNGAEAEVLLTDDECTIPHEVLAEPGTLFIAMRGVTLKGNIIKTTEEVKYKIVQGAKDIASTTAPSHDMFAQYCAAIAAGIAPHIEAMNGTAAGRYNEIKSDTDEALAEIKSLAGTYIRMATGSYVGSDTYGADNPNSLTFDFEPKLLLVCESKYYSGYDLDSGIIDGVKYAQTTMCMFNYGASEYLVSALRSSSEGPKVYRVTTTFSMNGNTVTWYTGYSNDETSSTSRWESNEKYARQAQMNSSEKTYHYIAIGV